ncbi:hypothetical protein RMSM_03076 [Rhodopirellula maiorica SM1]|uniref:Uncharacterized protein n=1 Tax=Rhodopirellula maiorica SM1 TaxID=1265738 RepID=M5S1D9_9BACT|nr:hypothetical protein RMSM_03076 [Rhodopirellula maiorica SM1]
MTSTSTLWPSQISHHDLMWNASKRGLKPGNPLCHLQVAIAADYPAGIGRG